MERITIIGTGLIGTSLGLALKKAKMPNLEIVGHDKEPGNSSKAQRRGAIDKTHHNLISSIEGSRMVIIATPAMAIRETMGYIAPYLEKGALVTDTGSTKSDVLAWAEELLPPEVSFVGGHPMAGKEESGPDAADENLFEDAAYAICASPSARSDATKAVASLAESIGAVPYFINAGEHDSYVAAVSHLPFLLSATLMACTSKSASWRDMSRLASTGYRDMTRLASGDPIMHRDICVTNQEAVVYWLDEFIKELYELRNNVRDDPDSMERTLISAWETRARWLADKEANRRPGEELPKASESMMGLVMGENLARRWRELNQRGEKDETKYQKR